MPQQLLVAGRKIQAEMTERGVRRPGFDSADHYSRVRPFRRRRLVVGLVALLMLVSGCVGFGADNSPEPGPITQSAPAVGTSFDPPSSLDLARAVPLSADEVCHPRSKRPRRPASSWCRTRQKFSILILG